MNVQTLSRAAAPTQIGVSSGYAVFVWAVLGVMACVLSFTVFGLWVTSDTAFQAVPITAADAMSENGLMLLRVVETISTLVALWALSYYLLLPWVRTGQASIRGLLLLGALVSYVLDITVNYSDYWMAWNKHAVNFGTWGDFFPGHTGPTQYAEAMLWGPPMYLYFGVALGYIQLFVIDTLRRKLGAGFALALAASFVAAFMADFVAESLIIRTEAYAWANVIGALSVWAGTQYQFPLYESLLVAMYSTGYTLLMMSDRKNGISFIEHGVQRVSGASRLLLRFLAATGFAATMTTMYFVGFNLFSHHADTRVELPSYLMYSDPDWTPPN